MLKLYILRPVDGDPLWSPWYDKAFGFVVAARDEVTARVIAQNDAGDEAGYHGENPAWTDATHSTCVELVPPSESGVVMKDFASA